MTRQVLSVSLADAQRVIAAGQAKAQDLSTRDLAEQATPGKQFYGITASNRGEVMIFAGGIPLLQDSEVVGAVGVSGGSGEQDQAVAEAAAAAL